MILVDVLLVIVVVALTGILAWYLRSREARPRGLTETQRKAVARSFVTGAQLMGRYKGPGDGAKEAMEQELVEGADADAASERPARGGSGGQLKGSKAPPTREELREAVAAFDEGLKAYPNDFSSRFLRAQALEELGELNDALAELDWLLKFRTAVKPPFLKRMAIAMGWMEGHSVAPLGTRLVGEFEIDLVVYHLRKRRGRVLLKKQKVDEALAELTRAKGMLDDMVWEKKLTERTNTARARMRTMKAAGAVPGAGGEKVMAEKIAEAHAAASAAIARNGVPVSATAAAAAEKAPLLGDSTRQQNASFTNSSSQATQKRPLVHQQTISSKRERQEFSAPEAQAEIAVLMARCFELQGKFVKASKCLHEATALGNERTKEEAKIALVKLEEDQHRGKAE